MASLMPKSAAKSGTVEQQLDLVLALKEQLNLLFIQVNHFRGACKSVDRYNRAVRRILSDSDHNSQLDPAQLLTEFVKFEQNYRISRKRFRKFDRKLLAVNLYDKLYELYESLVIGESIDSQISEPAVVDEASSFSRPTRIEDDVDNFTGISIELDPEDCIGLIQLDTEGQVETLNLPTSMDSPLFLAADVSSNSDQMNSHKFQCDQCGNSYRWASVLSRHKLTHQSKPRCDYPTSFKAHKMGVNVGERPFSCGQCLKSFKSASNLSHHKLTHEIEPRYRCGWEGCHYRTHYASCLRFHESVHAGKRPFQCSQCDKSFKSASNLSHHKLTHESEPRYRCGWEGCDFRANHPNRVKTHVMSAHAGQRPFQCLQCDKSFKSSSGLSHHKRTHKNEHQYRCNWQGCDYQTNHLNRIRTHGMSVHAGQRPFQCLQCDKSFKSSSGLSHHKRTHTNEQQYRCSWKGCDYRSNQPRSLKDHLNVHTGERPFTCDQCLKSFKSLSNLSHHKRIHDG